MSTSNYDNPYHYDNVYGHVVDIIKRNIGSEPGVHLDFGCGFGPIAEALKSQLGVDYIGFDVNIPGLTSIKERGHEALYADFRDEEGSIRVVDELLAGRRIASISLIDTLEHVESPNKMLKIVQHFASRHRAPFICSTPNATHRDIGAKLLFGRLDYTIEGLLDHTHLHFFSERSLTHVMRESGWHEVDQNDVVRIQSDQHFPESHAVVSPSTTIGDLLSGISTSANPCAHVVQFVRCYLPGPEIPAPILNHLKSTEKQPFLTVLTRTQARRPDTLRETLLCLSAQTCQDFEILIIGHKLNQEQTLLVERIVADQHESLRDRIRFLKLDRGNRTAPLNFGFENAKGDYVAILDDDDLVFAHWVETFKSLAGKQPGRILRVTPIAQTSKYAQLKTSDQSATYAVDSPTKKFPSDFDPLDHHLENKTPPVALAFPRSAFSDLALRFDESLTTTEDWDYLMRVSNLTGVASSPEICALYRMWRDAESSYTIHASEEWQKNDFDIWKKLDNAPLLLPKGQLPRIRELIRAQSAMKTNLGQHDGAPLPDSHEAAIAEMLRQELHWMMTSNSWMLTRPLRILASLLRIPGIPQPPVWHMDYNAMVDLKNRMQSTLSWKLTAPLRKARHFLH